MIAQTTAVRLSRNGENEAPNGDWAARVDSTDRSNLYSAVRSVATLPVKVRRLGPAMAATLILLVARPAFGVEFGPVDIPISVAGLSVKLPVTGSAEAVSDPDNFAVRLQLSGNLKEVQSQALALARAVAWPKDNCAHKGENPVVNHIDSASITTQGDTALLAIAGHATLWTCVAGVKIETVGDDIAITAPVQIFVQDSEHLGLKLAGAVNVDTHHPATKLLANLLTGDVQGLLAHKLTEILGTHIIHTDIPEIPGLKIAIESAGFAQSGPDLIVKANGTVRLSGSGLNTLLAHLK